MKRSYLGAVCEEGGSYGIVFFDFPGCISTGDTLEEILVMGAEALTGHIAAMLDYGDAIPEPTEHDIGTVIDWLRDEDNGEAIGSGWIGIFPIDVNVGDDAGLVTIRMRAELVRRIADMAQVTAQKLDSRAFIERAIEHELETVRKSAA